MLLLSSLSHSVCWWLVDRDVRLCSVRVWFVGSLGVCVDDLLTCVFGSYSVCSLGVCVDELLTGVFGLCSACGIAQCMC